MPPPGEFGEPGFGDQFGDIPEASDCAEGEKFGPPGVIPLTGPAGDHSPYPGVAPCCHGVIEGLIDGVAPGPKNIPVVPIIEV